LTKYL